MDIMFLHVQCECDMLKTSTKELKSHLTEMAARNEEVEGQLDEEAEKYRLLKVNRHLYHQNHVHAMHLCCLPKQNECDKLAYNRREVESKLCKVITHNEELEGQCQLTEVCLYQCVIT